MKTDEQPVVLRFGEVDKITFDPAIDGALIDAGNDGRHFGRRHFAFCGAGCASGIDWCARFADDECLVLHHRDFSSSLLEHAFSPLDIFSTETAGCGSEFKLQLAAT
jgi:hypothetical protein